MNRLRYFAGGSVAAMALLASGSADAQATPPATPAEVEEVVVTGSLIRGTPEDAALPVDVIGQEELEKQGSPSTVELLKALPVSNGVLGDTNQFDARAQGSEGSGSVNLRGLGPTRTLVLLNGRRLPINPFALAGAGAVDTNAIPVAAIGRVEVLKEGAAATYGSDAIGGVVNFITRKGQNGGEAGASYRFIEGSDGDYSAYVNFGHDWTDRLDTFVSLGWYHRSELSVRERDWANLDYMENPEGGWSAAGNPSSFVPTGSPGTRFRDPQCATLGGFEGFSGVTPVCNWHYTLYDNLVEKEDRYQAYGEVNLQATDTIKAHFDVMWSSTDVPHWRTSPSYALLSAPTASVGGVLGNYFVPSANPGLIAFAADHPTIPGTWAVSVPAFNITAGDPANVPSGALFFAAPPPTLPPGTPAGALVVASRPYALGGNPMFGNGPSQGKREFDSYRFSGSLTGDWGDNGSWDLGVTYGWQEGVRTGFDTVVNRYQLALRGYGSLQSDIDAGNGGCTAAETNNWTTGAGNAALGCYWFNPFSNAVQRNAITGQTNPEFDAALANSADLTRWFFVEQWIKARASIVTFDAVASNQFAFALPGGNPAWAAGVQHRIETYETELNGWYNRNINPCVDTPTHGTLDCANPNGPLAFLGVNEPEDLKREVSAVFGELSLPVLDAVQVQLAARYEHYGSQTGSTFDPKLSVRWQINDMFALRGSVGSTFRAPALAQITDNFVTSLQNIGGTFRAVDIYGNPSLDPESANTWSLGFIADVGGLNATIDYWNFDFENPIIAEPVAGIVNTMFPNGASTNCGDPAYAALQARFTFSALGCGVANVQRLHTDYINGAGVKTSGVDFLANYDFGDLGFAELRAGVSATYVIEYKTDATSVEGFVVEQPFDAVGLLNYQTTAYPLPQWKGEIFIELTRDIHNLRWVTRYMDSYTDQRLAPFLPNIYHGPGNYSNAFTVAAGKEIDSTLVSDLTYRGLFPMETTLVVAIENLFDEDPSFARLDLNYDPFTGDPLGRTVKVSLTKKF